MLAGVGRCWLVLAGGIEIEDVVLRNMKSEKIHQCGGWRAGADWYRLTRDGSSLSDNHQIIIGR